MTRQRSEELAGAGGRRFLRSVRIVVAAVAAAAEEEERDACLQMVMSVIGFAGVRIAALKSLARSC